MPTLDDIEAAYLDLLRSPAHETARALHCQKVLCVLRDIIAWARQQSAEDVQSTFEWKAQR